MPINPNIPLSVQPSRVGEIVTNGIMNYMNLKNQKAASDRADALMALNEEKFAAEKAEMDRKEGLRYGASFGQRIQSSLGDQAQTEKAIMGELQRVGKDSKHAPLLVDLMNINRQDPNQAKLAVGQVYKQAISEKLISAPEAMYSKPSSKDFTQESRKVYEATGKQSDLVPIQKPGTESLSPGEIAVDRAFSKDYVKWIGGDQAKYEKNLVQLKAASARLGGDENLTGPVIGRIPSAIRNVTNPASIAVRDEVEGVVQENLKAVLGNQFTEKEGIRLIARAYNENLPEEENKKRLDRLIISIEDAAKAKQSAVDYYEKNGSLKGFEGRKISMQDIERRFNEELKKKEKTDKSSSVMSEADKILGL